MGNIKRPVVLWDDAAAKGPIEINRFLGEKNSSWDFHSWNNKIVIHLCNTHLRFVSMMGKKHFAN